MSKQYKQLYKPKELKLKESDLANNPPRHPGLQDLDIWTEDQMRAWIKHRVIHEQLIDDN